MASTSKSSGDEFDTQLVRELAGILDETGLTEIEIERDGVRIRVVRSAAIRAETVVAAAAPPVVQAAAPAAVEAEPTGELITSPMVGTVYLQAQPGAPPFAQVGDMVQAGDTLLLIEAMKTMNPITAPRGGRLLAFLVADGQPVEYGEPLIRLE
jgi:acetyl-CoA carboxylase biotin carboxyl carrier protein